MSTHPTRKWSNQLSQEYAAYPSSLHKPVLSNQPYSIIPTTISMSTLKNREERMNDTYASTISNSRHLDISRATQHMENSLSRLTQLRNKHGNNYSSYLRKRGKENGTRLIEQERKQNMEIKTIPTTVVTNTIHTVHTIFVPTPSIIVHCMPLHIQATNRQPSRPIERPRSTPKVCIHYCSPRNYQSYPPKIPTYSNLLNPTQ